MSRGSGTSWAKDEGAPGAGPGGARHGGQRGLAEPAGGVALSSPWLPSGFEVLSHGGQWFPVCVS